jgi:Family of unknown function (DUF6011)
MVGRQMASDSPGADDRLEVERWLCRLGRRVESADLKPGRMAVGMRWLLEHDSSFPWLIEVKSRLRESGGLSVAEMTGVFNCWRVALTAGQRSGRNQPATAARLEVNLRSVPSGRYAVRRPDGHVIFYLVERGHMRWAGYTFLHQVIGGGRLQYVGRVAPGQRYRGSRKVDLAEVAKDPERAARLFGRELGVCAICGCPLTDDASRRAGVGPKCVRRLTRIQRLASAGAAVTP